MNWISENKEACDDHDRDIAFISRIDKDIFSYESHKASEDNGDTEEDLFNRHLLQALENNHVVPSGQALKVNSDD